MQIFSSGIDFTRVASSLSLATANYKPVPVAESSAGTESSSSSGRVAAASSGSANAQSNRPESTWGMPSVLHLPQSTNGNSFRSSNSSSGQTVGSSGCTLLSPYSSNTSLNVEFPSFNKSRANMMRYREQMGVNVGSWFVLENWMAPSMFECAAGGKAAEFDIVNGYGTSQQGLQSAQSALERHWDTWVTEDDFKTMKSVGINTVRLPIGYWSAGPDFLNNTAFEPYASVYQNSFKYVKRAIYWANKYNIGILIDLHAAYGAQNSQAHSGFSTGKVNFYTNTNEKRTAEFLVWLTKQFADVTNVVGIELLNEPQNNDRLWPWYNSTMNEMRQVNKYAKQLPLYFHDAFSPSTGAKFAAQRDDFVVQDTHSYYVYTKEDQAMTVSEHTSEIKGQILTSMQGMAKTARGNMVVGEWSCALNPNSFRSSTQRRKSNAEFCQAQMDTYRNATAGALFWSWTMENCKDNAGWCFKAALPGYMNGSYNVWGFSSDVSNTTIDNVSSSISKTSLPTSYRDARTSAGLTSTSNACTANAGPTSSSLSSSTATGGGARVAAVVQSSSSRSSSQRASYPTIHAHQQHSSSHSSSKHGKLTQGKNHKSHSKNSKHSSSSSHDHSRRSTSSPLGGGPVARAAHLVNKRAVSERNAGNLGYADGFVTAQTLAAQLTLSRVGFTQQYLSDTLSYYTKQKVLGKSVTSTYKKNFNKGLLKLERSILSDVEKITND
ncbi:hypothetical protein MYAM1_003216 [Malassezia yamatoensis]|uniref:Glycoside hydrolase family 5 domain-containing protein n=1 Tax=Malassezia yamatoensis TaxID=253288 RepID=A0AAJ6CK87_9BASI|nr:hypothetical protein MYAM1_003216 [Malassezia yamatoensis]